MNIVVERPCTHQLPRPLAKVPRRTSVRARHHDDHPYTVTSASSMPLAK